MNDVLGFAIIEWIVEYVDERYGRAAAWLTAILMLATPIAVFAVLIWWVAS